MPVRFRRAVCDDGDDDLLRFSRQSPPVRDDEPQVCIGAIGPFVQRCFLVRRRRFVGAAFVQAREFPLGALRHRIGGRDRRDPCRSRDPPGAKLFEQVLGALRHWVRASVLHNRILRKARRRCRAPASPPE
ncbi:MAG: hypothetical protein D6744_04020 [Planctomycetota bacterium]|nr:MAG: hypothetical protein D6744_04020 [Planctomycetota bacterium]